MSGIRCDMMIVSTFVMITDVFSMVTNKIHISPSTGHYLPIKGEGGLLVKLKM